MPDHSCTWDEPGMQDHQCKGTIEPGWAHMNPDGTLHCNSCGWVSGEVITAYSPSTDKTYLTWDDLVQAEANGYVVVSLSSRKGTAPAVAGPWDPTPEGKAEARKAQARLRRQWNAEERRDHGDGHKISTYVRIMWRR